MRADGRSRRASLPSAASAFPLAYEPWIGDEPYGGLEQVGSVRVNSLIFQRPGPVAIHAAGGRWHPGAPAKLREGSASVVQKTWPAAPHGDSVRGHVLVLPHGLRAAPASELADFVFSWTCALELVLSKSAFPSMFLLFLGGPLACWWSSF